LSADDSLLFFKAKEEQALQIHEILMKYATSTGQLINPNKCSLMFGKMCPAETKVRINLVLHTEQEEFETKYLGLPTPKGRMSSGKFQSLQATLAKCLVEWDDNHKSQVGKGCTNQCHCAGYTSLCHERLQTAFRAVR
jgi:hypothetical protein